MNLYELSARFEYLLNLDELTEEECKEIDSLFNDVEDACIARAKYIRNRQAELESVIAARKEMQEREKALENKIERNEVWLAERMQACKIERITKSPLFPIRIRHNPVSVDEYDKTAIPEKFWRTKVTETKVVDKTAVKAAIDAGESVSGARLIQKLRVEFK